jgi:aminoglycoside phosphotransferase (APT) family kinase protein
MDPELWEPFVRHVAGCHGFECHCILPGLPGSFPTFIVEQGQPAGSAQTAFVVKFFGPLFEGKDSFHTELAMGHFIAKHDLNIPSPVILAEGRLSSDWYYLVFEYIPGDSMGQVYQEMSKDALQGVAMQMGKFMHQLHALTATSLPVIPPATRSLSWEDYADFLEKQRADCLDHHRSWNDLPSQLLDLLPGYIPPIEQLLDYTSPPHLIHGDLTADHLLGWLQAPTPVSTRLHSAGSARDATTVGQPGKGWESLAIIDWGDCRVGNILYELAAVHLDLFRADKRLLRLCLQAYGLPIFYQLDFARKAFSTVLLHQFPMPAHIYSPYQDARSLDELADGLFGISFGSETH